MSRDQFVPSSAGASPPPVELSQRAFPGGAQRQRTDLFLAPPAQIHAQRDPRAFFVHLDAAIEACDRWGVLATAFQPAKLPVMLRGAGRSVAISEFWSGFLQPKGNDFTTPSVIVVSALARPAGDPVQQQVRERLEEVAGAFGCVLLFVDITQRGLQVTPGQAHQRTFRPVS